MHERLTDWIVTHATPRMLAEGVDWARGGYAERLGWSGQRIDPGYKRVRVVSRQIYAFSHIGLGGNSDAVRAAEHGVEFLLRNARLPGGLFASRLNSDGSHSDVTADLYDTAFVLFSMAWWYRLSGDSRASAVAKDLVIAIRGNMRHPSSFGFVHRVGDRGPSQQNPHMHLLEAAIFLAAFTGEYIFYELATEIYELFRRYLFDPESDTLAEFFDDGWQRIATSGSIIVEPGHHFEWCWLLARYSDLTGDESALGFSARLFSFAEMYGFDSETGLIYDAVDPAGKNIGPDFRSWPNLEYLKALVAREERDSDSDGTCRRKLNQTIERIFQNFLTPRPVVSGVEIPVGLWLDYVNGRDLSAKVDHIPVSTFYHIVFAFMEVTRHRAGLEKFSGLPW